ELAEAARALEVQARPVDHGRELQVPLVEHAFQLGRARVPEGQRAVERQDALIADGARLVEELEPAVRPGEVVAPDELADADADAVCGGHQRLPRPSTSRT